METKQKLQQHKIFPLSFHLLQVVLHEFLEPENILHINQFPL